MTTERAVTFAPEPGTDLVPDGWADDTVYPWLQAQTRAEAFPHDAAKLAGLEAAYKLLDADTLEIVKARRYLEVRWGELLGPAKPGPQLESSHASEDSSPLAKDDRHRFRQLAEGGDRVIEAIKNAIDAEEITRAALLRTATGAHVGHNSGENEWYTPREYIESARKVMGSIDLDPASTAVANEVVAAQVYLTEEENGLLVEWGGNVWMNPPYSQPLIGEFCSRLVDYYASEEVKQACVLVNNATDTSWFHSLAEVASAICFTRGRVRFWAPDKKSATPLQGQAIVYFGWDVDAFRKEFSRYGFTVKL